MMSKKLLSGMAVFTLAMMVAASAWAGAAATQTVQDGIATVTITYSGDVTALGYQAFLPDGVSLVSVDAANAPDVKKGTTGTVDFAWLTPPPSPVTFSYTVAGEGEVGGQVLYRVGGGDEIVVPVK
jgi:hypothetical protein